MVLTFVVENDVDFLGTVAADVRSYKTSSQVYTLRWKTQTQVHVNVSDLPNMM